MKYYKTLKGTFEKKEITKDDALMVVLGTYKDNDMTRDMLERVNRIDCMFSTIEVEEETKYGVNKVLMAGLYNQMLDGVEYDEEGNRK